MPVTSSTSSVKRWPGRDEVHGAAVAWAARAASLHPEIRAIGYFGSYARGDHGVGSDLDLIVIWHDGSEPPRTLSGIESLPVPAQMISYDLRQWRILQSSDRRMARVLRDETIWLHDDPR